MQDPLRYTQWALISTSMRSKYFRIFASAATFFLMLVGTCVGQNTTYISLDQAIDLALTHNHSLQATRTLILQNQAQEITANLRPNPTLGADSQFVPIFNPQYFSADNLDQIQQFDIGIGYLFERGHKRPRRLEAARDQTAVTRCPGRRRRTNPGFQRRPAVRQRFIGGINSSVRASGSSKLSADRRYQRGTIEGGIHRRRRLSQDQTAASAIPDRRVLCPSGESAGACKPAGVAGLQRGAGRL